MDKTKLIKEWWEQGDSVTLITLYEVKRMFQNIIFDWFDEKSGSYNDFIKALLLGDLDAMNEYMNGFAFEGQKVLIG